MKTNTQANRLISVFDNLYARFGLPEHVVTDNGPQYRSDEFRNFLKIKGIKHTFSPPYYPATNGAAENFVRTFKSNVDKIVKDGISLEKAVNMFLLDYRTVEYSTTGRSSAFIMFKRELRNRFDLLKPNVESDVNKNQ